jgi:S1-C subfamily serine protease
MGKTIIVFENGKVVDTIEEEKWEGVKVENGRLFAAASEASAEFYETPPMQEPPEAPEAWEEPEIRYVPEPPAYEQKAPESVPIPEQPAAPAPEFRSSPQAPAAAAAAASAAASAAAAQYPWRGEAAYDDIGKRPGKRGNGGVDARKVVAVLLGLILAAGAGFGGGIAAVTTGAVFYQPTAQQITITPTDQVSTTEAVAAKVTPSVVGITSLTTRTVDAFPFGAYENRTGGVGTGIIVDANGYILTNSHVVLDGEVDSITVLLPDGRDVRGDVLWNERSLDLAIVKVDATNLTAAELGDSDSMRLGSYVAAIGNPMGLDFRSSISQGVVSGLDRTILAVSESDARYTEDNSVRMEGLIQVDAAINVGNSGGPLINSLGQVIGVNTARNQNGEGMGFAIPINTAKPIVDSVKATGEFHRVYIGITLENVTDYLANNPQADLGVESGAYVTDVTPNSPAESAGIAIGDIIVEVDGKKIDTSSQLIKHLLSYKTGDVVKVKILREKRQMTFDVTLTDLLEE